MFDLLSPAHRWSRFRARRAFATLIVASTLSWLSACSSTGVPEGIEAVSGFEISRYLGTWYEIARLDHAFERGLEAVSAEYALADDGSVRVANRGWSIEDQAWQQAEGRARFEQDPGTAHLAVSFFGPFYGSYVVFELDPGYQQAFVTGDDRDTLWFLARTPTVSEADMARFASRAEALGFDLDGLIRVDQRRNLAR